MSQRLYESLVQFSHKVNDNSRLRKLLKDWEPLVLIETKDTQDAYCFPVRGSFIGEIETEIRNADHQVLLKADCAVLEKVFTGELNPARAHLDGALDVYGSDKDEVKLDAISLVLWGI